MNCDSFDPSCPMSMDSLLLSVTQSPPEICDDKRLKSVPDKLSELVLEPYIASGSDTDTASEPEPEPEPKPKPEPKLGPQLDTELEQESESEPELDPRSDWELIPIEKLTVNDLASRYDDDPSLFCFRCPQFVYKNKAYLKNEEEIAKVRAEYFKLCRSISPFDAIPVPPLAIACGSKFTRPLELTEQCRPLLTYLSNRALKKFNAKNKGSNYVFDELVKATSRQIPRVTYYITFKAKDDAHPHTSDSPATTFQAHVWRKPSRKSVVKSCSIKT
ncbi:uncharacterized protein [Cicer arietinum]|uniref:Uncharacterized protein LOC101491169 n=1 Tax=Cicer arietinum TaxID=3827 RepID=A0A1S2YPR6_CICAR|nr:uncharacterized protein LOC101491169 [Cicer arietinum]